MKQVLFNISDAEEIIRGIRFGKIKTRDGFDVTILHLSVDSSYPVAGIVHLGNKNDYVKQWTEDGKADHRRNVTTNYDLVIEMEGGEV